MSEVDKVREAYLHDNSMTGAEYARLIEAADETDRAREAEAEKPEPEDAPRERRRAAIRKMEARLERLRADQRNANARASDWAYRVNLSKRAFRDDFKEDA